MCDVRLKIYLLSEYVNHNLPSLAICVCLAEILLMYFSLSALASTHCAYPGRALESKSLLTG